MNIDKTLIQDTKVQLKEIFGEQIDDIRLEGIDVSQKNKLILIFSFLIPSNHAEYPEISNSMAPKFSRHYKIVTLNKHTHVIQKINDRP